MKAADRRRALGRDGVLSLAEAVRSLPIASRRARSWLRKHGLVRSLDGKPVVIWGDVLDHLTKPESEALHRELIPIDPLDDR